MAAKGYFEALNSCYSIKRVLDGVAPGKVYRDDCKHVSTFTPSAQS